MLKKRNPEILPSQLPRAMFSKLSGSTKNSPALNFKPNSAEAHKQISKQIQLKFHKTQKEKKSHNYLSLEEKACCKKRGSLRLLV